MKSAVAVLGIRANTQGLRRRILEKLGLVEAAKKRIRLVPLNCELDCPASIIKERLGI